MEMVWSEALALMQRALGMLDESQAPAQIGAHLDLAIVRLQEHLSDAASDDVRPSIRRSLPD